MNIESKDYAGRTCILVNEATGKPVMHGDPANMLNEPGWIISGGRAPHKPESSGRVWVQDRRTSAEREFFPSVVGAAWIADASDTQFASL